MLKLDQLDLILDLEKLNLDIKIKKFSTYPKILINNQNYPEPSYIKKSQNILCYPK